MSEASETLQPAPELLDRARTGDRAAADRIAADVYPRIRRWALALTGDPHAADDVTQDALVRLLGAVAGLRDDSAFSTWLYRIVRSAALDRARAEERRRERTESWAAEPGRDSSATTGRDALARIGGREVRRAVEAFLDELAPRQREIFDLVDLQEFEPAEVARMLDVAPGTVRATLFRARRIVRERLIERHPELVEGRE